MINLQDLSLEQKKQFIKLLEADILNSESKNIFDELLKIKSCLRIADMETLKAF